jgi:hypothetical protein
MNKKVQFDLDMKSQKKIREELYGEYRSKYIDFSLSDNLDGFHDKWMAVSKDKADFTDYKLVETCDIQPQSGTKSCINTAYNGVMLVIALVQNATGDYEVEIYRFENGKYILKSQKSLPDGVRKNSNGLIDVYLEGEKSMHKAGSVMVFRGSEPILVVFINSSSYDVTWLP